MNKNVLLACAVILTSRMSSIVEILREHDEMEFCLTSAQVQLDTVSEAPAEMLMVIPPMMAVKSRPWKTEYG